MTDKKDAHAELMRLVDEHASIKFVEGIDGNESLVDKAYEALDAYARTLTDRIAELERVEYAYNDWQEKTEWVQKTAKPKELGRHRADVMRDRIAELAWSLAFAQDTQAISTNRIKTLEDKVMVSGIDKWQVRWTAADGENSDNSLFAFRQKQFEGTMAQGDFEDVGEPDTPSAH